MQFQTSASLVTLALAGALVVPQIATAACYSGADVKTTVVTSELVPQPPVDEDSRIAKVFVTTQVSKSYTHRYR